MCKEADVSNLTAGLESFLAEIRSWSEADADAFFRELEANEQPDGLPHVRSQLGIVFQCCFDCHIDDFCHIEGCELDSEQDEE